MLVGYNGRSWIAIVTLVVGHYNRTATRTVRRRHIHDPGDNPEAAELSGANVKNMKDVLSGPLGMPAASCRMNLQEDHEEK